MGVAIVEVILLDVPFGASLDIRSVGVGSCYKEHNIVMGWQLKYFCLSTEVPRCSTGSNYVHIYACMNIRPLMHGPAH